MLSGHHIKDETISKLTVNSFFLFSVVFFVGIILLRAKSPHFHVDFEPYYLQGRGMIDGLQDLYSVRGKSGLKAILPLTYTVFILPITLLPQNVAEIVFYLFNILILFLSLFFILKLLGLSARLKKVFIAISLIIFPINHCLGTGQVGIILLFLLILSFYFYTKNKSLTSSFLLALASSFKIIPIFIIPLFIVRKEFKYVLHFFYAVVLVQLFTISIGGWSNFTYYWTTQFIEINKDRSSYVFNQSLIGYINRLSEYFIFTIPHLNQIVPILILGVFYIFILFRHTLTPYVGRRETDYRNLFFETSILLILINISTPIGWPHHFAWIVFSIGFILRELEQRKVNSFAFPAILTVGTVFLFINTKLITYDQKHIYKVLFSGNILFGSLFILLGLVLLMVREDSES